MFHYKFTTFNSKELLIILTGFGAIQIHDLKYEEEKRKDYFGTKNKHRQIFDTETVLKNYRQQ